MSSLQYLQNTLNIPKESLKAMKNLWSVVLVAMLALGHADADARRLGGGKSVGQQSSNVSQRQSSATPSAPGQNTATQNAATHPATPAATPATPPAKKPWGAMLGGLAAGLGLAWLASSLGLGGAFGNILLFLVLAGAVVVVIGLVMRSRKSAQTSSALGSSPLAFQGGGTGVSASDAPLVRQYNPEKVGNDASARPWESQNSTFEAMQQHQSATAQPLGRSSIQIGSALAGAQNWGIPEDFDTQGFLAAAKRNFTTLQSAWDRADISTLRSMMTDEMLGEIRTQLSEREAQRSGQPAQSNQTEVVMLEAQLLGIEDLGHAYMASVEFSGMIREEHSAGPSPFREVWNMTKPKNGTSGWLVAGLQALQ